MLNIFSKTSIGLDIADRTIEIAELRGRGNNAQVVSLGRVKLASGIVERGEIKDEKKLLEAVKKVFIEATPNPITEKKVSFGLPELQVFTHILVLKSQNKKEIEDFVSEEAAKNIPLEKEDLSYSYKILTSSKEQKEILLVATSKKIVSMWQSFFAKADLQVEFFDIETLAVNRALEKNIEGQKPYCVLDIGSATANIAIFDSTGLRYAHSIAKAGDFFTIELSKNSKLSFEDAEKEKIKADLQKGDKISNILIKSLQPILKELKKTFQYWEKERGLKIQEIILIGGSAKLKGLTDYLASNLGIKVALGNSSLQDKKDILLYLEAIGLALRKLNSKWKDDPVIANVL